MKYLDDYKIFENKKSSLVENLDKLISPFIKRGDVAGVNVGIYKDNKELVLKSWGYSNLELDIKLKPDNVFEIASITKHFTAAAIMQLVEAGKIDLDDNIKKWIKIDTKGKKITVRNLLGHTAGFGFPMPGAPNLKNTITKNGRRIDVSWKETDVSLDELVDKKTRKRIIEIGEQYDFQFEPGDEQSYSNFGFILLSFIIEKTSGKTYEDYIQKNIFDKVGMKSSYCGQVDGIIKNKVTGYERKNIGEGKELRFDKDNVLVKSRSCNLNVPLGAGCIQSTVGDLHKWNQFLHGEKLFSEETYKEYIKQTELNSGQITRTAKGLCVTDWNNKKLFFHAGGIDGFSSMNFYFPEDKISVMVFINTSGFGIPRYSNNFDTGLAHGLESFIINHASHWVYNMDVKSIDNFSGREEVVFSGDLDKYVGLYKHSSEMTLEFIKVGKKLHLNFNKSKKSVPLYYIGQDTFSEGDFYLKFSDKEVHLDACGGYMIFKK